MKTKSILTWDELHQVYLKLNQCPGFLVKHQDMKLLHQYEENFDSFLFWENLILLAAEGLSDKE